MHLAGIRMGELPNLEINEDQATKLPVIKHEIHAIPFAADSQSFLARYKCKITTELKQEAMKIFDYLKQMEELEELHS